MLGQLKPRKGSVQARTRVGRGIGSGLGKTAGRGYKGQRARSGGKKKSRGFEGGQMPLQRRLPKQGFTNKNAVLVAEVTTRALNVFANDTKVTVELLKSERLIPGWAERVKLIVKGKLDKKLNVSLHGASKGAAEAITAKGGTLETVN
jgi:large subunit ribosomal protein L15